MHMLQCVTDAPCLWSGGGSDTGFQSRGGQLLQKPWVGQLKPKGGLGSLFWKWGAELSWKSKLKVSGERPEPECVLLCATKTQSLSLGKGGELCERMRGEGTPALPHHRQGSVSLPA